MVEDGEKEKERGKEREKRERRERERERDDTQTIFSEFSDPYRRSLIDRICAGLVRYKVQIPQ
jgi:hypothetical protein